MARIPAWVGPLSLTCAVCCSSPAMHARSDHVAAPPPPPPAATVATIAGGEPGPTSGPDAPSVVADEPDPPSQQLQLARDIWQRLAQTHNTCPDSYDYHPEGGLRMFACHLRALVPYRTLHEASGLSVFLSGPHTDTELSLTSDKSFGYYNPELVRWMVEHLVPGAHDSAFRAATQGHYDTYVREKATQTLPCPRRVSRRLDDEPPAVRTVGVPNGIRNVRKPGDCRENGGRRPPLRLGGVGLPAWARRSTGPPSPTACRVHAGRPWPSRGPSGQSMSAHGRAQSPEAPAFSRWPRLPCPTTHAGCDPFGTA